MGSVRVHEPFGSKSQSSSKSVDWNNWSLIHACSLNSMWFVWFTLMTSFSGLGRYRGSIRLLWNYKTWALILRKKTMNSAGFLGVTLDCDASTGLLEMKQTGLIKRVIKALSLDDGYAKGKHTSAKTKALVKDVDGEVAHGRFSYSSVVGMLLYLSGHTRPDIAYAVNCCARCVLPKALSWVGFETHWEIPQTDIRSRYGNEPFHWYL